MIDTNGRSDLPERSLGERPSVPFSNGTEVDWFRAGRCDHCVNNHPEGGGCDEFVIGVIGLGEWPDILYAVPNSAANPLGVDCTRFEAKP